MLSRALRIAGIRGTRFWAWRTWQSSLGQLASLHTELALNGHARSRICDPRVYVLEDNNALVALAKVAAVVQVLGTGETPQCCGTLPKHAGKTLWYGRFECAYGGLLGTAVDNGSSLGDESDGVADAS